MTTHNIYDLNKLIVIVVASKEWLPHKEKTS